MSHDGERGAVAVFVAIVAVALLLVAGLAFDGGMAIAAKRRAMNVAEQAARAGAEQLSEASLRANGTFVLDPAQASAAAQAYLANAGYGGSASVAGNTVTVSGVTWSQPTVILGAIGVQFSGTVPPARARNAHGIATEQP